MTAAAIAAHPQNIVKCFGKNAIRYAVILERKSYFLKIDL
jgi:hypothetical protein